MLSVGQRGSSTSSVWVASTWNSTASFGRQPDLAVQPHQRARAAVVEAAVGGHDAQIGLLAQVVPVRAGCCDVLLPFSTNPLLSSKGRVITECSSRRGQEGHAGLALAAGDLGRDDGIVDRAGVDRVEVGVEQVAALLEEGAPLGIEQGEGRVDVDLGRVGLDLAEVGIERGLGRELGGDVVGDAQAHLGVLPGDRLVLELAVARRRPRPGWRPARAAARSPCPARRPRCPCTVPHWQGQQLSSRS